MSKCILINNCANSHEHYCGTDKCPLYYPKKQAKKDKINARNSSEYQFPSEKEILSEAKRRQLDGAEPYSFAAGARWIINYKKE